MNIIESNRMMNNVILHARSHEKYPLAIHFDSFFLSFSLWSQSQSQYWILNRMELNQNSQTQRFIDHKNEAKKQTKTTKKIFEHDYYHRFDPFAQYAVVVVVMHRKRCNK